jgi:hypothetical protein
MEEPNNSCLLKTDLNPAVLYATCVYNNPFKEPIKQQINVFSAAILFVKHCIVFKEGSEIQPEMMLSAFEEYREPTRYFYKRTTILRTYVTPLSAHSQVDGTRKALFISPFLVEPLVSF